jgi:hypothetical protein
MVGWTGFRARASRRDGPPVAVGTGRGTGAAVRKGIEAVPAVMCSFQDPPARPETAFLKERVLSTPRRPQGGTLLGLLRLQ